MSVPLDHDLAGVLHLIDLAELSRELRTQVAKDPSWLDEISLTES